MRKFLLKMIWNLENISRRFTELILTMEMCWEPGENWDISGIWTEKM